MKLKTALLGAAASFALAPMAYADGHEGDRGRDGEVKIIYWQAPSIFEPVPVGRHQGRGISIADHRAFGALQQLWRADTMVG